MSLAVALVLILLSFCSVAFGQDAAGAHQLALEPHVAISGPVGRITFTGAVVVGTLTTPWTAGAVNGTTFARGEQPGFPPRMVVQRPLSAAEVAPQLRLLQRAGERFGSAQEMVVTYL